MHKKSQDPNKTNDLSHRNFLAFFRIPIKTEFIAWQKRRQQARNEGARSALSTNLMTKYQLIVLFHLILCIRIPFSQWNVLCKAKKYGYSCKPIRMIKKMKLFLFCDFHME